MQLPSSDELVCFISAAASCEAVAGVEGVPCLWRVLPALAEEHALPQKLPPHLVRARQFAPWRMLLHMRMRPTPGVNQQPARTEPSAQNGFAFQQWVALAYMEADQDRRTSPACNPRVHGVANAVE